MVQGFRYLAKFGLFLPIAVVWICSSVVFADGVGILVPCNATDGNGDGIPDNSDSRILSVSDATNIKEITIRGMGLTGISPLFARRLSVSIQTESGVDDALPSFVPDQKIRVFDSNGINQTALGAGTNILSVTGPSCSWIATEDKSFFVEGILPGGSAKIRTRVSFDGQVVGDDEIRVRTNPFLILSNCDPATQIFISDFGDPEWMSFIESMSNAFENVLPVTIDRTEIPFAQDQAEFGAFWPETENTLVWGMKFNAYTNLLSSQTGYFGFLAAGCCGGNVESIPPTERFPYGRIVVGNTLPRSGMELLSAQSLQTDNGDLVVLDVAWLEVGHVDEVMAVVPSPTGKFKILLADVRLAADLIAQDENIEAYGPDMSAILMPYKDAANQAKINAVQSHLNGIRRTLLESLDIEANDIVSIPVLFSIPSSIEDENLRVTARLPNSVNLVSVPTEDGNMRIAIPDPFYIPFTDYLENVFFQLGIDDKIVPVTTMGPHEHGGEAHCASIVVRKRIP